MRDAGFAVTTLILGSLFGFATGLTATPAQASSRYVHHVTVRKPHVAVHHVVHGVRPVRYEHPARFRKVEYHARHIGKPIEKHPSKYHAKAHVWHSSKYHAIYRRIVYTASISCVPFARADSGIKLPGNAWQWWGNAAGVYERGRVPVPGSVLAFRSNPRMPLGHVAVVAKVINPREIEIDQANWVHGRISRDVPVVDVSEANDWTAVRVEMGRSGSFGGVYPTYGFIYDRPDNGTILAAAHAPAPQPVLNPAPTDLRPEAERPWATYEEVAEAPTGPRQHFPAHRIVYRHAGGLDRK